MPSPLKGLRAGPPVTAAEAQAFGDLRSQLFTCVFQGFSRLCLAVAELRVTEPTGSCSCFLLRCPRSPTTSQGSKLPLARGFMFFQKDIEQLRC